MAFLRTAEDASEWSPSRAGRSEAVACAPERPLSICHVITRLPLGGAEENTVATCLHQAECGHRVTLVHGGVAHPSWSERIGSRVKLVPLLSIKQQISPLADLLSVRDLLRLYRQLQPDIVHTHESKAGITGRIAAALARVPLIVHTIHIAPFLAVRGAKRWLYLTAERACAGVSHLLIAVSRGMQKAYLDEGLGRSVPIPVIHSGMPLEKFTAAERPFDWRSRIGGWDRPERPRFILKLAAFEERKRHLQLIRAMAPGLRERPDACLLLAGEGPERSRCEQEAEALGISHQVRFLGHDPAPWELIALADLCVHASEREGLPRSAVQAIAGGKPLVVARLPGIEEILTHGSNGLIAAPDDLSDLAQRTFELLDNPDRLAELQKGARATDVTSWGAEMMGVRIDHAYANALTVRGTDRLPVDRIEFLGLPGAGKTTLARQVLCHLRDDGPTGFSREAMGDDLPFAHRTARRLAMVAGALLTDGAQLLRLSAAVPVRSGSLRDRLKTRWNLLSVLAMQLRPATGVRHPMVLDQGLVQAIWSAQVHHGEHGAPAAALPEHLNEWLGRTLFVHVRAPADVTRKRLAGRRAHTSRFQDPARLGDLHLWTKAEQTMEALAAQLDGEVRRRGLEGRLLAVQSGDQSSPEDNAALILKQFAALRRQAPPDPS